jgi:hypothetical protein
VSARKGLDDGWNGAEKPLQRRDDLAPTLMKAMKGLAAREERSRRCG